MIIAAGLVNTCRHTADALCISESMKFAPSPFTHRKKQRITERCSLCGNFNGNVVVINVYYK